MSSSDQPDFSHFSDRPSLKDYPWAVKYTPEQGNLIDKLYLPLLRCAQRYDRLTGYFNAGTLFSAMRGVEALICYKGRMRLIVGCILEEAEIEAIHKGLQTGKTPYEKAMREWEEWKKHNQKKN